MLFTCLPQGARIPGRFPGPPHPRGKWHTLDILCLVNCAKAAAMVEGNEAVSQMVCSKPRQARKVQAQNRANGVRTAETRAARPSSALPTWI